MVNSVVYYYENKEKVVSPMEVINLDIKYNRSTGHSTVECKKWRVG